VPWLEVFSCVEEREFSTGLATGEAVRKQKLEGENLKMETRNWKRLKFENENPKLE
jgi:hypothetical protein